jgi:hypothetical protein
MFNAIYNNIMSMYHLTMLEVHMDNDENSVASQEQLALYTKYQGKVRERLIAKEIKRLGKKNVRTARIEYVGNIICAPILTSFDMPVVKVYTQVIQNMFPHSVSAFVTCWYVTPVLLAVLTSVSV